MVLGHRKAPKELWKYRSAITSKSFKLRLEYDWMIVPLIKEVDMFRKYMSVLLFHYNVNDEAICMEKLA